MPRNTASSDKEVEILSTEEERSIVLKTLVSLADIAKGAGVSFTARQRATLNFCLSVLDPEPDGPETGEP